MHIHLDLIGGLAGDMFLAAAIDADLIDVQDLQKNLCTLGLGEDIKIVSEDAKRGALSGTHVRFEGWDPSAESDHRHLSTIETMIRDSDLEPGVKNRATQMFRRLGRSEAKVHDIALERVHFHEVGAVDSILDFVSAAYILETTGATWSFGAIPTGKGTIETAHGTIPVPAPATASLLSGFELVQRDVEAELVTPTGAAILASLNRIQRPNAMLSSIGYGAGTRDLNALSNVVRMMIFKTSEAARFETDTVIQLTCEIDDMNPELLADFADRRLFELGALDVVREPIHMKKGRQGTRLSALVGEADYEAISTAFLEETTTFGLRVGRYERLKLGRRHESVETEYGTVDIKIGLAGSEVIKRVPEYESCRRVATTQGVALMHVWAAALAAAEDLD